MKKCMSNVMNNNCPEIIGNLFEKCKNFNYMANFSNYQNRPIINSMNRSFIVTWELRSGINI